MLLQEIISGRISVWPGTVAGWIALAVGVLTTITLVVGGIWKVGEVFRKKLEGAWEKYKAELIAAKDLDHERLRSSLKDMGKRIGDSEKSVATVEATLHSVEYRMQGIEFKQEQTSKELTQLETLVSNLAKTMADNQSAIEREIGQISRASERMAATVELIKENWKRGET